MKTIITQDIGDLLIGRLIQEFCDKSSASNPHLAGQPKNGSNSFLLQSFSITVKNYEHPPTPNTSSGGYLYKISKYLTKYLMEIISSDD